MTVTRIATPTPTIPVIVDIFEISRGSEGPQAMTVTRIATPTPTIPVIVDVFESPRGSEGPKAMTLTRIGNPTPCDPCDCSRSQKTKNIQKIKQKKFAPNWVRQ